MLPAKQRMESLIVANFDNGSVETTVGFVPERVPVLA